MLDDLCGPRGDRTSGVTAGRRDQCRGLVPRREPVDLVAPDGTPVAPRPGELRRRRDPALPGRSSHDPRELGAQYEREASSTATTWCCSDQVVSGPVGRRIVLLVPAASVTVARHAVEVPQLPWRSAAAGGLHRPSALVLCGVAPTSRSFVWSWSGAAVACAAGAALAGLLAHVWSVRPWQVCRATAPLFRASRAAGGDDGEHLPRRERRRRAGRAGPATTGSTCGRGGHADVA